MLNIISRSPSILPIYLAPPFVGFLMPSSSRIHFAILFATNAFTFSDRNLFTFHATIYSCAFSFVPTTFGLASQISAILVFACVLFIYG